VGFAGQSIASRPERFRREAVTSRSVAAHGYKFMAYKDEEEVARLYSDAEFEKRVSSEFEGDLRAELNLAPSLFARRDPNTGQLRKKAFWAWMVGAMLFLAKFEFLRGTPFDIFGRLPDRVLARALRDEFEATIVEVARDLAQANSDLAL
jgi:indolepyruvate ferredoxin oxidoreductase